MERTLPLLQRNCNMPDAVNEPGTSENRFSQLENLQAAVGRTVEASATITCELVRRFNATFDREHASTVINDIAPLAIHFCLAPVVVPSALLRDDGHPAKSDFLPAPLPRRMWAGGELEILRPLLVGQTVHRRSRIDDVRIKEGRSGLLCFVTVEHSICTDGAVAIRERQDIVYRDQAPAPTAPAKKEPPAERGEHERQIVPSAALLFRYSALTFNSHRIHYDRTYATQVEHHAGLVVHGPLQATLLLQFAADLKGGLPPARFSFRSTSPLYDESSFKLHARRGATGLDLWTAALEGPVAMQAQAQW